MEEGQASCAQPVASQSFAFAFAAGSELSADDRLFVAMVIEPEDGELTFATVLGAQHEESTAAVTKVREAKVSDALGAACETMQEKGTCRIWCSHHSEHLPQREAISRFAEALPGLAAGWADVAVGDCTTLLWSIEVAATPPGLGDPSVGAPPVLGGGTRGIVCRDARYSTGPKVWPAAVSLCKSLGSEPLVQRVRGGSVLELGCGLGLPGIAAALHLGAQRVVLTDSGADVEAVMGAVVSTVLTALGASRRSGSLRYAPLVWGTSQAEALLAEEIATHGCGFDLILCADCVYEPFFGDESWKLLADTLAVLLSAPTESGDDGGPVAVLSVERRIEGIDGVDSFLDALSARGLSMRRVTSLATVADVEAEADVEVLLVRQAARAEATGL